MISETARTSIETTEPAGKGDAAPMRTAAWAARLIGLLTLAWVYLAYTDLRWLLHLRKVHNLITRAPFAFDFNGYFACMLVNVATPAAAACALLLCPAWLLRALTPAGGRAWPLSRGWFTTGIAMGLILFVLSMHSILATALWTIYSSGQNAGWQVDLATSVLVAAGGIFLCRKILTGHQPG